MRLTVHHRTQYRFSAPQRRIVQMLRLTPGDTDQQTVIDWRIDIDRDARLREGRDGFGNRVTMLYADGPIDAIEIAVRGEVLSDDEGEGMRVTGTAEPFPCELWLRTTDRTAADDHLVAFLAPALRGADGEAAIVAAARRLAERLTVVGDGIDEGLSARAALDAPTATPRDAAHILIAGLRAAAIPARYVWGYRAEGDGGGEATPHAWVEAHGGERGWIAVDPGRGAAIGRNHVRVAVGLDSATAAPIAGSRLGRGREMLDVETGGSD